MSESLDNRYMEFRLGDQLYAIPLLSVKEVIQKPDVTIIPNMPTHFEGMINLRGQILGVFSVRKRLGAKAKDANDKSSEVVIVVEQRGVSVGMTVDEVTRVLHVTADTISPAPLKEGDPAHKYISCVIRTEKDLVQSINIEQLLEFEKYKTTQKVA